MRVISLVIALVACGPGTAESDAPATSEPTDGLSTDTDTDTDTVEDTAGTDTDTLSTDTSDTTTDTGTTGATTGSCAVPSELHYRLEGTFDGVLREAWIDLPDDFDGTELLPVVFNMHGLTMTGASQRDYTGMAEAGNARGWIVVHPSGTNRSWDYESESTDTQFMDELIVVLSDLLCIDPARVYMTGLSNGGYFSYQYACDRGSTVAAIAPVAGLFLDGSCNPGVEVPLLHIHGTGDNIVGYDGYAGARSAPQSVEDWATEVNSCSAAPAQTLQVGEVTCETRSCGPTDEATLCTVDGGGHSWPGAGWFPVLGTPNQDIDANEVILDFFAGYSR